MCSVFYTDARNGKIIDLRINVTMNKIMLYALLHFCLRTSEVRDSALRVHLEKPIVSGLPQLKPHAYSHALCLATFGSALENVTGCYNLRTMQTRNTRAKIPSPQYILKPRNIMAVSCFGR